MSLIIEAPPVPLRADATGVLRIGKTRVPLDTVVYIFNQGASPEEIVMSYPTLTLIDVYAIVNYYVHNRDEVDHYIRNAKPKLRASGRKTKSVSRKQASARGFLQDDKNKMRDERCCGLPWMKTSRCSRMQAKRYEWILLDLILIRMLKPFEPTNEGRETTC